MDRRSLESTARRWMTFWQGASLVDFDAVHAPDFIDHSASGRSPDRDGLRRAIVELYQAFPDFDARIDRLALDEVEHCATIRWTGQGWFRGTFMGAPPSGRRVTFAGIELIRIAHGQVVERWGEWDEGSILAQLHA